MFRRREDKVAELLYKSIVVLVSDRFGFLFDINKPVKRMSRLKKFDSLVKNVVFNVYDNKTNKNFISDVNKKYDSLFTE